MRSELLSPFIYWAQDESSVFIKIDLKDIAWTKDKSLRLTDDSVELDAFGVGAHGAAQYAVRLRLYDAIQRMEEDDTRHVKVTDSGVQLSLTKQDCQWWPRLLHSTQKPPWLKIDFERWKSEDDEEDYPENEFKNGTAKDVLGDYPDLFEKLKKDEFGYKKEELKKVYLILYNLSQFVFFTYIIIVMAIRYAKDGPDSMEGTFDAVGNVLKFCQLIQFLEVMHPMFGYTRGSIMIPFIQVTARAVVLFAMIDAEPRMHKKPVVFYLFFIWSLVEVVRYPYYIVQLYKCRVDFLTWLRYSVWIPLYPLGILCEGIIILRNIPYFEETQRFSIAMPNSWNFTFHSPTAMKIYLLILFFPGMYAMMTHMYRARVKKIGVKRQPKKVK
ncbi:very-long-chain (3R)-3-hydroxyacyl-CoA dehydratase [Macrosteles quadrilineatus]|uniref:very-long-chain (3R)-3-hydroxyacyl-CoA dehydratase n=1 Tax=Macrosteles quadrilineatus TaxID=74068 RepID=UPI0023E1130A|nr:very-long-chain (3R)-3-hydroxyacyl-CoA dehydratase [Macrosteles quadrilineatus]XP_054288711.1 very-long-chain (3R)-3-hydroxyacyl-CoA dehydratase [Macrosteles quadrilineatus]